jgi:hypothetical protein
MYNIIKEILENVYYITDVNYIFVQIENNNYINNNI